MLAIACAVIGTRAAPSTAGTAQLKPWVGATKPAFALDLLADASPSSRIDLASLRDRVVLVHFFATWCEPCRAELAALDRLAARWNDRRLTVLAINTGEVEARLRRFFEAQPVTFKVLLDRDKAVTKAWGVEALPTTFVLDPALKTRLIAEGDYDWDGPETDRMLAPLLAGRVAPSGAPALPPSTDNAH